MKKNPKNFFEQYRKQCEECNHGKKVVIPSNDPLNGQYGDKINILFVNERPGPTAVKTGFVSFENPDSSAWFFKYLFEQTFGLKYRKKIFITNAVLWCSKKENDTPNISLVKSGLEVLSDQIEKLNPKIIVPLGTKALYALKHLYKNRQDIKSFKLSRDAGKKMIKGEPIIYPVIHTGLLGRLNRYEAEQLKDWRRMARNLK